MTYSDWQTQKENYYIEVWKHTEQNKYFVSGIEKRGNGNCIDHIIPITLGFQYSIAPEIIGSFINIRIISSKDNLLKASRVTVEVQNKLNELGIYLDKTKKIIKPKKPIILIYPDYAY